MTCESWPRTVVWLKFLGATKETLNKLKNLKITIEEFYIQSDFEKYDIEEPILERIRQKYLVNYFNNDFLAQTTLENARVRDLEEVWMNFYKEKQPEYRRFPGLIQNLWIEMLLNKIDKIQPQADWNSPPAIIKECCFQAQVCEKVSTGDVVYYPPPSETSLLCKKCGKYVISLQRMSLHSKNSI